MKRPRVIGTTDEAIIRAERELGRAFPPSFRSWLMENNGLGVEGVCIFPVRDDRDVRKTWDSIVRNYRENWAEWLETFEDEEVESDHLLPFADFGTGDYYGFDYRACPPDGECPVVWWSHETGETEHRAANFSEFVERVKAGDFDMD